MVSSTPLPAIKPWGWVGYSGDRYSGEISGCVDKGYYEGVLIGCVNRVYHGCFDTITSNETLGMDGWVIQVCYEGVLITSTTRVY